jgi:hypothetical protein
MLVASFDGSVSFNHTDKEHPLPPLQATLALHGLVHGRHHNTREHASYLPNGSENGRALCDLRGLAARMRKIPVRKLAKELFNLLP